MKDKKVILIQHIKNLWPQYSENEVFALINCGKVLVNGQKTLDHKRLIRKEAEIQIIEDKKYVSRGGNKLDPILAEWCIDVRDKVFIDAGSSTGGFTDCLLKRGARMVYAVDVGYNQLDFSLRKDSRVLVYENTNIMNFNKDNITVKPYSAICDLSFRSILGTAGHIFQLITEDWIIVLIKPQFEWKKPESHFTGVIKSNSVLESILLELLDDLWEEGSFVSRINRSPLNGADGNREYFFLISKNEGAEKKSLKSRIKSLIFEGGS